MIDPVETFKGWLDQPADQVFSSETNRVIRAMAFALLCMFGAVGVLILITVVVFAIWWITTFAHPAIVIVPIVFLILTIFFYCLKL